MMRRDGWRENRSARADGWNGSQGAVAALAAMALVFVGLFLLLPLAATSTPAVREITFVTRDMAFYLDGETGPNPTIRLEAGDRVRFILRNLDPGIDHNLAIDDWGLATRTIAADAVTTLEFEAPARAGRQTYTCSPHREMMRGVIEVVGD